MVRPHFFQNFFHSAEKSFILSMVKTEVVAASARPITHKLVARAASGRRLTIHSKQLVLEALNRATGETFHAADLFDY